MFYIKDMKDLWNIGVVDTTDDSIEYYNISQIEDFIRKGIRIVGVASNFSIFEVDNTECIKYYTGDYQGVSKYDALVLTDSDGTTRTNSVVYRIGMLYQGITHTVSKDYAFFNEPQSILIGGYDTKHIWCDMTSENYLYCKNRLHLRYLPEISGAKIDIKKAFAIMGTPLREHYEYGYATSNVFKVDAVQDNICSYIPESGDTQNVFIRQLIFSEQNNRVWVITNAPAMLLENFYQLFADGRLVVYNAVLTDTGFTYWGLDGTYSVDMNIVRGLGRFVSAKSKVSTARGKLLGVSSYEVQEDGRLVRGSVCGGKVEIPEECTYVSFDAIHWSDDIPISCISVPSSCVRAYYEPYGSWWGKALASTYTIVFKSNATEVVFALISKLNKVSIRGIRQCIFDWDNSNKATLLVGFFAYKWDNNREQLEGVSVEDVLLCAEFYLNCVTPNLLKYSMPINTVKLWKVSEDYSQYMNSRVNMHWLKSKQTTWADWFVATTIKVLKSSGGVNLFINYLRLRLDEDSHLDCHGWLRCFSYLIGMTHGDFDDRFNTESIRLILEKFWNVFKKLLTAHIKRLQRMYDTKNYKSFDVLVDRYFS